MVRGKNKIGFLDIQHTWKVSPWKPGQVTFIETYIGSDAWKDMWSICNSFRNSRSIHGLVMNSQMCALHGTLGSNKQLLYLKIQIYFTQVGHYFHARPSRTLPFSIWNVSSNNAAYVKIIITLIKNSYQKTYCTLLSLYLISEKRKLS